MTAKEFYNKHNGRAVDIDGTAGVQCVDLFKAFTKENYGISNYNCTNGYASGLWIYRKSKPYYSKFKEVSINSLQNGDWVFWAKGSRPCPKSHVAMYYNGKFFGQNQGQKAAKLINISTSGVLGVLRPKMYVKRASTATNTSSSSFLPARGYIKLGDKSENISKLATFMRKTFPSYTPSKALGNLYGPNLMASIKEFQRRVGLKPDGMVGPLTLAKLVQYGFTY